MRDFNYYIYSDGSYSIGEIGSDNYVTGLGYIFWQSSQRFAIGAFESSSREGWILANGDSDGNEDTIYLSRWESKHMTDGVAVISKKDILKFVQTTDEGTYEGMSFVIWPDGGWRYKYEDETGDTRFVEYLPKEQGLVIGYMENAKTTWYKTILTSKQISDFGVPFHHFHQDVNPDITEFIVGDGFVAPDNETNGPSIIEDDGITTIGYVKNGKLNGMAYVDSDDTVAISQEKNGNTEGGYFSIRKSDYSYLYNFYLKGLKWPTSVHWFGDDGAIEIRRFVYKNKNQYDYIQIDNKFNVVFAKGYDTSKKASIDLLSFDYEKEYKSNDNKGKTSQEEDDEEVVDEAKADKEIAATPRPRPKPLPKTKADSGTKKVTKTKKSDDEDDDDWTDAFKGLFK